MSTYVSGTASSCDHWLSWSLVSHPRCFQLSRTNYTTVRSLLAVRSDSNSLTTAAIAAWLLQAEDAGPALDSSYLASDLPLYWVCAPLAVQIWLLSSYRTHSASDQGESFQWATAGLMPSHARYVHQWRSSAPWSCPLWYSTVSSSQISADSDCCYPRS